MFDAQAATRVAELVGAGHSQSKALEEPPTIKVPGTHGFDSK